MELIRISTVEVMSSRQVAELTGKEHKNVMRDIRILLEQGVGALNFELGSYIDANNQERPEYLLTKKGCLILASGYNPILRERIIDRWDELENANKQHQLPQTFAEALMLAANQAKLIEEQDSIIAITAPKAEYHDNVLKSVDLVTTTMIAKEFGLSAIKLNNILEGLGIQFKVGGVWVLKQKFAGRGFTKVETTSFEHNSGLAGSSNLTKWTEKGRKFIIETLVKYGYTYKG